MNFNKFARKSEDTNKEEEEELRFNITKIIFNEKEKLENLCSKYNKIAKDEFKAFVTKRKIFNKKRVEIDGQIKVIDSIEIKYIGYISKDGFIPLSGETFKNKKIIKNKGSKFKDGHWFVSCEFYDELFELCNR